MQPDIPPIATSQRNGFIDEAILSFSSKLFQNIIYGYIISILYNLIYIYYWKKNTNIFSIFSLTIFYFLLVKIIQILFFEK